jgi:hypothetical protein
MMATWMRAYRARNVEAGLCRDCGSPKEPVRAKRRCCARCANQRAAAQRAYLAGGAR